jgi:ATP-dependent DNA helicase RecG
MYYTEDTMITLETSLSKFPSVKLAMLARLKRLHIETVGDLLYHFPFRYEDYSEILAISDAIPNEKATFEGTIISIETKKTWKKQMLITEGLLEDETGQLKIIWFNQKHIAATLKEGSSIRVSGKVILDRGVFSMTSPAFEFSQKSAVHTGKRVPIYPETTGVTSKYLRWQIGSLLNQSVNFSDPIPQDILTKLHLPSLTQAFRSIHSPASENERLVARKRFAFDEMFFIQLKALQIKMQWDVETAIAFPLDAKKVATFLSKLPFQLTKAQEKASQEIARDLQKPSPMNRLLNGDVGSGKTIVAALAALQVANADYQVVILAPTEVLAKQHFESLLQLFHDEPFETALFTQAYQRIGRENVNRETLLQSIRSGIARVIIATHAVLQKNIHFHNLSLVIVDEQHRFGVAQRAHLQQEAATLNDGLDNAIPHFLTMTATPIPRTLALSFFGNLDLSLLDEMPKNRKPIITRIATSQADRKYIYQFIQREIDKGRQAFVILPFVEESTTLTEVKAAVAEHKRLSEDIFPHLRIGLLHGKLKSKEKGLVMTDFKDKKLDVLVATSVVEVGIDIPNASVMLIEDADRFGLSQLHQFRGRVGRGEHSSYCFLFPGENASASNKRLQAMIECTNGFDLAEKDLTIRGPGALFGTRQSGIPDIAMENIANVRLIQIARDEAQALLAQDPHLAKHAPLQKALTRFDEKIHLE